MCNKRRACAEADAAKRHVGEWCLPIDSRHAHAVQFVIDEAAREGVELADANDVLLFALLTVERLMSARAAFDVVPLTGERGGK